MGKTSTLTWTLILLVLLPSGVLAWLGLKSADAFEAAELQRLRTDAASEAELWRGRAAELRGLVRAAIQDLVDWQAQETAAELPGMEGPAIARRLREVRVHLGSHELAIADARLLDASGRTLFPVPHSPAEGDAAPDLKTRAGMLAHLRREADRAFYGAEGDAEAAIGIWSKAMADAQGTSMKVLCDVEAARVRARSDAGAALAEALRLEGTWSSAQLVAAGRPAFLLWLEVLAPGGAADAGLTARARELRGILRERFRQLVLDGTIDATPLTASDRRRIHGEAARYGAKRGKLHPDYAALSEEAQSLYISLGLESQLDEIPAYEPGIPSVPVGMAYTGAGESAVLPDPIVFESKMPGGARLVVRVPREAIAQKAIQVGWQRWRMGGDDGQRRVSVRGYHLVDGPEYHDPRTEAVRDAAITEVPVTLPGDFELPLYVEILRWRDVHRAMQERRAFTVVGILALMLVTLGGAFLTRRAILREREARRIRDDFIANVTHEVRTPLTSVLLHSELLIEEDDDETKRREHAAVVQAQGQRLAALVGDMLDFAALERGTRTLESVPVDLAAACRDAVAPYRVLAEREGADVAFVEPAGSVEAMADPAALARILGNLVGNAWKHGRPSRDGHPGRLRIVAREDAQGAVVEVRDDGPGIPTAERERVFERFGRGRAAIRKEGSGIGLSLAKDLARAMGGDLTVHEEGSETVFRLRLAPIPDLDLDVPDTPE